MQHAELDVVRRGGVQITVGGRERAQVGGEHVHGLAHGGVRDGRARIRGEEALLAHGGIHDRGADRAREHHGDEQLDERESARR